jgi:hypothetical protein
MSSKQIPLGAQEHELLRAIARSAPAPARIALSSTQRLRFELLGLIEDRADGVRLTERGRALAASPAEAAPAAPDVAPHNTPRDRRGRRLGLRRRSPF